MYQELLTIKGDFYCLAKEDITCISDNWALPTSYLEFVQELGFGRLLGLFLTYIPMGKDNNYCDSLERRNAYWKDVFQQYICAVIHAQKERELRVTYECGAFYGQRKWGSCLLGC